MDIMSHTLSGAAVGALAGTWGQVSTKAKWALFALGAAAGALPDIDAISGWRRFKSVIGVRLGLESTGLEIYRGKLWYSHHAFTHSLLWCVCLFAVVFAAARLRSSTGWSFRLGVTASLASLAHILGDLPTPAGSWGGVALLFPSSHYIGGWGWAWWWNNYDLVLLLAGLNVSLLLLSFVGKRRVAVRAWLLALGFVILGLIQLASRPSLFLWERGALSYEMLEESSLETQRALLPGWLMQSMEWIDRALPMPF